MMTSKKRQRPTGRLLTRQGDLVCALFGARGSGKSHRVKAFLAERRPRRVLIWDTMGEYGAHARAVPSLAAMLEASRAEAFTLRYVPRGTDKEIAARFGAFCEIAYARARLLMVVEELQRVTGPAWAPAQWSDCTLRGRHRELTIFGVSQRPASVDKNFFSNCSLIGTGRLNFRDDVLCMANVMSVPAAAVQGLREREFIVRDMLTGALMEGAAMAGGPRELEAAQEAVSQKKLRPPRTG